MSGRGAALGALGELHHQLDRCLASAGLPAARADGDGGLLFDTRQGEQAAAFVRADGGVQLVACPGYLGAAALQALHDSDGGCADGAPAGQGPLERLWRDLVSRWRDARAEWFISVDRWEGAVHLSMVLPDLSALTERWDEHLQAFEQALAHWEGRLQPEPAGGAAGAGGLAAMDPGRYLVRG